MRAYFLAAVMLVIGGAALAQSLGLGQGIHEIRRIKPGAAAASSCLLVDVGSKLLANTGSCLRAQ